MRTGQEVWQRAMLLLGYTDEFGDVDGRQGADLLRRGCAVVNQIYADLWFGEQEGEFLPLSSLQDSVRLQTRVREDVMPYGVAMMLADLAGDGESQARFAALYSMKRASTRGGSCTRTDVLFHRVGE